MSAPMPIRRLAPRCLSYRPKTIASHARLAQIRAASSSSGDNSDVTGQPNPVLEEYYRKNPGADQRSRRGAEADIRAVQARQQADLTAAGDLPASSIFDEAERTPKQTQIGGGAGQDGPKNQYSVEGRTFVLDPDPKSRERWERKRVVQAIRKGGRMTREQMLKRTEREHLARSQNIKTSVKKLMMLARQIAGKPLDEAIEQMRFSKKKAAESVHEHLLAAKDEAVVIKGMALSNSNSADKAADGEPVVKPAMIQLKNGKRYTVEDPKRLYIDQAWVGRGPYGKLPDYRARGRMHIMRTPWTSLSVLLKEDKTRLREYTEREDKRRKQRLSKLWTHLPDRPLQGPRGQYYSW